MASHPSLALGLVGCLGAACGGAAPGGRSEAPPQAVARLGGASLSVELEFGPEADLDLYVTDPARETIYFANSPSSASGGRLEADLRCDAPAPRIERVRFEDAPPGRYRLGIDYPEACRLPRRPAAYRLRVESADGTRLERTGELSLGEFRAVTLEFEVRR